MVGIVSIESATQHGENRMTTTSRYLLLQSNLVNVSKELAMVLKPTRAMLLQHLHFWVNNVAENKRKDCYHDGRYWWYHSIVQWQRDFPFFTTRTIERALDDLVKAGLILKAQNVGDSAWSDRTNWYTVNGKKTDEIFKKGMGLLKAGVTDKMSDQSPTKCRNSTPTKSRNKEIIKKEEEIKKKRCKPAASKSAASELASSVRNQHIKTFLDRFNKSASVQSVEALWKVYSTQYHGKSYNPLKVADRRSVKEFVKYCREAGVAFPLFMEWAIVNWKALTKKKAMKWCNHMKDVPSFTAFYVLREQLVEEYRNRNGKRGESQQEDEVFDRIEDVPKDHPHYKSIIFEIKKYGRAIV
jgi:hypothetical protein